MAMEFLGRLGEIPSAGACACRAPSEPIGTYRIIPIILEIQSIVEQTPRQALQAAAMPLAVGLSPRQPQMFPRTSL
jgi:hypothetical protein